MPVFDQYSYQSVQRAVQLWLSKGSLAWRKQNEHSQHHCQKIWVWWPSVALPICDRVRGNRAYAIKIWNWVSSGFRTVLTLCTFVANLKPIALFFVEIQLLLWWPIPKVIIAERQFFLQCTHCAMFSVYLSIKRIDWIKRSWTLSRSQSTQEAVKQGLSSLQEDVKQGPSSPLRKLSRGLLNLREAVKQGPSSLQEAIKQGPSSLQEAVKQRQSSLLRKGPSASAWEYLQMPYRMLDQRKDALWG